MRNIVIGLLILLTTVGCASTPKTPKEYGYNFLQEKKEEIAQDLCKQYAWGQANAKWKVVAPSINDVCMGLHMCAQKSNCRLTLPDWHYNPTR